MVDRGNLADPDYEPTDEQLIGLSKRAFAHVRTAHEASLQKLRAQIATARDVVLRELRELRDADAGKAP